ncbi:unnamed protein product [Rotaria sp. Silwood2]|nr:unnamed protein product [Rotaria sp. Silwood2]CAF4129812.1 unnamed protein product [Rotaria sp. Silwood2]
MSIILIVYFILMVIVPIRTFTWDGQFNIQGACNTTACCCPAGDLLIQKRLNVLHGALQIGGSDCTAGSGRKNFTVTGGNTANAVASLGTFTPRGDNTLDNTPSGGSCTVTMSRIQSSTNGSGGGSQNSSNTTTAKNHVSSNYDSFFIKFISIIMATTVIMHI